MSSKLRCCNAENRLNRCQLKRGRIRITYCKIPKVVEVEKKVRRRRDDILRSISLNISNARVESINNKIKVTVTMGYGFRNTDNLISLLMLRCSDIRPQLPWKQKVKAVRAA